MLSKLLISIGNSHSVMTLQAVGGGLLQNCLALAHPCVTVAMKCVHPVDLTPDYLLGKKPESRSVCFNLKTVNFLWIDDTFHRIT